MNYEELKSLADQSLVDANQTKNFSRDQITNLVSVASFKHQDDVVVIVSAKLKIGKLILWRCSNQDSKLIRSDYSLQEVKSNCIFIAKIIGLQHEINFIESAQSIDDLLHTGSDEDNIMWDAALKSMYSNKKSN